MPARFFLDTNVFVYSFDAASPAKRQKAQHLIDEALTSGSGIISYQVVQEFCNVALVKFEKPFTIQECASYLDRVLLPLCDVFPSADLYHLALRNREETGFSFYDSLIVASAIQGGCKTLYSEDLQAGRRISQLSVQNPF